MNNVNRETRLNEYAEWVRRLSKDHDVGFTLSPDSTIEALRWLIAEIHDLEFEMEKKTAYVKELEWTVKSCKCR